VNTPDLVAFLSDVHRDKLAMRERHVAVAELVSGYDFNNAYQYVIAREDMHLAWLESAITELGGKPSTGSIPSVTAPGKNNYMPLVAEDAKAAQAFVDRWRPRIAELPQARHRTLLQLVLGETLEQKRFFDQITAGNQDLLGRRSNGPGSPGTGDGVIAARWLGDL